MRRSVFRVFDFDDDDGARKRPAVITSRRRQQLRGQWGVKGVGEQHKLELNLWRGEERGSKGVSECGRLRLNL